MKIKYYLNFKKENRISMEEYAQQLIDYQLKNYKEMKISSFRPKLSSFTKFILNEKFKMRYLIPHKLKNYENKIYLIYVISNMDIYTLH